jgi:hypothetical protein
MRHLLLISIIVICTVMIATPLWAEPTLRMSWDHCDPLVQNRSWQNPGLYRLVLSATNVDVPVIGSSVEIAIGPEVSDTWRFDSEGCQAGRIFAFAPALSKTICSGMLSGEISVEVSTMPNRPPDRPVLQVTVMGTAPGAWDPSHRFTLINIDFDLRYVVAGPPVGLLCGGAEVPVCLHIVGAKYLVSDETEEQVWILENDYVTWQDPNNNLGCPGATQGESRTWGRLKGLYR